MSRPRNPFGDPVKISRSGKHHLRIRYYPTGIITDPAERMWLSGRWHVTHRPEAEQVAAELRDALIKHRSAHGLGGGDTVTVADSVAAFIAHLEDEDQPEGTSETRRSQLGIALVSGWGSEDIESLKSLSGQIVVATHMATLKDGKPIAPSTVSARLDALAVYGKWIASAHQMADPFVEAVADQRRTSGDSRKRALAKVDRIDPFCDDDDDGAPFDPDQLPSLSVVVALRDAIIRRETGGNPLRRADGRGSRGGAPPLAATVAAHLAESVTCAAASGLRLCELLGLHTSRIRSEDGVIIVDRQLNRYRPWLPGSPPTLAPPKGNRERVVQVFPAFEGRLAELVAYADEHQSGWVFGPTRGQRTWVDCFPMVISRAAELLRLDAASLTAGDGLIPLWESRLHDYADLRVMPTSGSRTRCHKSLRLQRSA